MTRQEHDQADRLGRSMFVAGTRCREHGTWVYWNADNPHVTLCGQCDKPCPHPHERDQAGKLADIVWDAVWLELEGPLGAVPAGKIAQAASDATRSAFLESR